MAPELIIIKEGNLSDPSLYTIHEHKVEVDGYKCDVYSMAILYVEILQPSMALYEMLSPMEILHHVVNEGLRPHLDDIPENLSQLIRGMWVADPHERPALPKIIEALHHTS